MIKTPENILFSSLKNGSQDAFKKVYQDNRSPFMNFAKKYGISEEDVLDIYQEAYIAFYENVSNGKLIELSSSIATYLTSIGKYMILDKLRKNKKKPNENVVLEQVQEVDDFLESFDLDTHKLNAEQQLLQKYFNKLGDKCKEILTLFYYKMYSIKQIMTAGSYNSENVVKSQKSRCLKGLRESIKENASY